MAFDRIQIVDLTNDSTSSDDTPIIIPKKKDDHIPPWTWDGHWGEPCTFMAYCSKTNSYVQCFHDMLLDGSKLCEYHRGFGAKRLRVTPKVRSTETP